MSDIFDGGIDSGSGLTQGYFSLNSTVCSTGLIIDSVTNANNGFSVYVVLSGVNSGPVTFYISHVPDLSQLRIAPSAVDAGLNTHPPTYNVLLPHPGLWYIWAHDAYGITALPGAVWMDGVSDTSDLDLTGQMIRDVLDANTIGINAVISRSYPEASLQQVVYGYEGAIINYPSILISSPRVQEAYVAFPFTREATYSFTIQCFVVHSTEETEVPLMGQLTRAIQMILNQPAYETFILPSGAVTQFNFCSEASIEEYEQDGKFMSVGSMVWSGRSIYIDNGLF